MVYEYDDRTTGYDARDNFGRHDNDAAYDDGEGYGVSHSHSYGHGYDYPSQQQQRLRSPAGPVYEYEHGQYNYPTGIASQAHPAYAADARGSDRILSDDGAYGAGGYGRSTPSAYGSGRSNLDDVWLADEKHGPVRDERPMLIGSIFCFIAFAIIGVVCGIMLAVVFVRPPNVGIAGYTAPDVFVKDQKLMMNTTVFAGVNNPNSVSAKVKQMHATIYERSVPDQVIGTSNASGLKINSNGNTTLKLPVQFELASVKDLSSNSKVLSDIVSNCGWNLPDLAKALGSSLTSNLRRDVSPHSLAKRATNHIPLLVDIDLKVSVLSLNFNSPAKNASIGVKCPSLASLTGGNSGSASTSASSSSTSSAPTSTQSSSSSEQSSSSSRTTSATPAPTTSATPAPTTSATPTTSQNPTSEVSSIISENPSATTDPSFLSSVASQAEGAGNAFSGIFSFLTAGSLPIRRAAPTNVAAA